MQYLKDKGKLDKAFQFTVSTPPSSECEMLVSSVMQNINSKLKTKTDKKFSKEAECLTDKFGKTEAADNFIKILLTARTKFLSVSVRNAEVIELKHQLKDILQGIALHCIVDANSFIEIFDFEEV